MPNMIESTIRFSLFSMKNRTPSMTTLIQKVSTEAIHWFFIVLPVLDHSDHGSGGGAVAGVAWPQPGQVSDPGGKSWPQVRQVVEKVGLASVMGDSLAVERHALLILA